LAHERNYVSAHLVTVFHFALTSLALRCYVNGARGGLCGQAALQRTRLGNVDFINSATATWTRTRTVDLYFANVQHMRCPQGALGCICTQAAFFILAWTAWTSS
jgi:hypothetical protein